MSFQGELRARSRTFLVLLVLLAFTALQSAAAIAEHPHNHGKDHSHCCTACHAGHLGVLQASAELKLSPPSAVESSVWPQQYRAAIESPGVPSPSRAPPRLP